MSVRRIVPDPTTADPAKAVGGRTDTGAAVRVRVAGLVFFKDEILIVEHGDGSNVWACFPGGKMKPGEAPEDCLRRELAEELRPTCTVESLVGVGDLMEMDSHNLELFFRCSTFSKELVVNEAELRSAQFVKISELSKWTVYPLEVAAKVVEIFSSSYAGAVYFGRFS